jgi:energy-coupling factor transporter ATP-binding protein EcfA2
MFKLLSEKSKMPEDCYEIAKVYEDGQAVEKIVCKYKGIGRNKEYLKGYGDVEDNVCPLCKKELSSKASVKKHLNNYSCPIKKLKKIEDKKIESDTGFSKEINLPYEKYLKNVYPNIKLRDIVFIFGAQGSGKSTYCRNYLNDFFEEFCDPNKVEIPKAVIMLSNIQNDTSFNDLLDEGKIIGLDINDPSLITEPLDTKTDLLNSLTIFDDYDNVKDKEILNSLYQTLHDVITIGRDHSENNMDTYCIITAHDFDNRNKITRDITKECSIVVMFPKAGQHYYIDKCLKNYCGMDKKTREKVLSLDSRWVAVQKRFPMFVASEIGCFAF